jgi:glycosyltransferase involved in cell wall biosynthesis
MSKISVILNCLNSTAYLREAIDSVYAQTYTNWEIILWDNASQEDVKSFLSGYDERLKYFRGEKTVNLGEARNLAMSKATGELFAFLDCDDIWMPEKLSLCIPCFDDPEVGLVYTKWNIFNALGYCQTVSEGVSLPEGWVFKEILFKNFTCLSTLIFRSDIVHKDKIQFDPQFNYLEDTDFLIKVARKWKFAYVNVSLTHYRMHAASATATKVEGFREEMDMLIDKFSALYPEVKEKYADQLRAANRRDSAIDNWRKGERKIARNMIYPILKISPSNMLIYMAMYLPFKYINWIRQILFRRSRGYYY